MDAVAVAIWVLAVAAWALVAVTWRLANRKISIAKEQLAAQTCTTSQSDEWDQLVTKIGLLTLTVGVLEAAVMAMHCKATSQSEEELKSRLNRPQREGLKRAVKSLDWPDDKKTDLTKRLADIEVSTRGATGSSIWPQD
jgi:hypothetical protein